MTNFTIEAQILHLTGITPVAEWLPLFENGTATRLYIDLPPGIPSDDLCRFVEQAEAAISDNFPNTGPWVVSGPAKSLDLAIRDSLPIWVTDSSFEEHCRIITRARQNESAQIYREFRQSNGLNCR